jgi:acyl-coenzyme A synthetase/AMP-(fatty) acid ligase
LSYHGRVDDVLSVGGFKMSPIEVEEALLEYPSVEQCLITTEADDHMGTALVCYVVLSKNEATTATTTADLRTFLSRRLATYKVPRKFEMVTELPRGGSGKLKRPRPTMV